MLAGIDLLGKEFLGMELIRRESMVSLLSPPTSSRWAADSIKLTLMPTSIAIMDRMMSMSGTVSEKDVFASVRWPAGG